MRKAWFSGHSPAQFARPGLSSSFPGNRWLREQTLAPPSAAAAIDEFVASACPRAQASSKQVPRPPQATELAFVVAQGEH